MGSMLAGRAGRYLTGGAAVSTNLPPALEMLGEILNRITGVDGHDPTSAEITVLSVGVDAAIITDGVHNFAITVRNI
jgi:hypothetical protein